MAKIDFKENGSKGVESSRNSPQEAKKRGQEQTKAINDLPKELVGAE